MNEITVTMPIKKYDEMRKQIQTLQGNSIYKFTEIQTTDYVRNEYDIILDVGEIIDAVISEHPHVNKLIVKDHDGLLLKPIKVNAEDSGDTE